MHRGISAPPVFRRLSRRLTAVLFGLALCASGPASALSIQAETDASLLAAALVRAGSAIEILSATLQGHTRALPAGLASSSGVFTNASGTYGIGSGVVLSSGDVNAYGDGPNLAGDTSTQYFRSATSAQEAMADLISGGGLRHFDVTQLDLGFRVGPGVNAIELDMVLGTEEWPEYVGSHFRDGVGIFLDGVLVARLGGLPLNVDHPDMQALPGTELDAVLAPGGDPLLRFAFALAGEGDHTLTVLVFDASDSILDSTVYVSDLRPGGGPRSHTPEPGSGLLLGAGLIALAWRRVQRPPRS